MSAPKKNIQRNSPPRKKKSPASLAEEVAALRKQISSLRNQASFSAKKPKKYSTGSKGSAEVKFVREACSSVAKPCEPILSLSTPVYELKETRPATGGAGGFAALGENASGTTEDVFFGSLLDFARVHWLMGRWNDLAEIDLRQIENHPDRAHLALFGAVGWLSKKDLAKARSYIQAAVRYGCPAQLISRVLLSGAHSSLAATYGLAGRDRLSLKHQDSVQKIMPLGRLGSLGQSAALQLENSEAGSSAPNYFPLSPQLRAAASSAASSGNPTEAVAQALRSANLTQRERFVFLREVAARFLKAGNKMVAAGFLEEASHLLDGLPESCRSHVIKDLLAAGLKEEAFEVALRGIGAQGTFTPEESLQLREARNILREKILMAKGHGHEVLLAFLSAKAEELRRAKGGQPPTVIEIGTTRESASGQGSTRRLMEFCRQHNFHFITVDMDSANTQMAAQMFRENGVSFKAVHAKGEDFLASYDGDMDCIFLDAYDFDHGKHTELRQSRYEKFLGARINEADCHKMHLDCASAIVKRLKPWTVVCLDDTWLEAGRWVAKGTSAMRYLLEQGLQLLDVRNRSALLGGSAWFPACS
jgi:hypothetical protein